MVLLAPVLDLDQQNTDIWCGNDDDDEHIDDDDDDDDDDGLRWSVETGTNGRLWRMSAAHLILRLLSTKYSFTNIRYIRKICIWNK